MSVINPEFWGPSGWRFIHSVSFTYPEDPTNEEKKRYIDFILNLQHILPCFACRKHLRDNLRNLNFNSNHMKNRNTFSRFCVALHNEVNDILGKPKMDYEVVKRHYTV